MTTVMSVCDGCGDPTPLDTVLRDAVTPATARQDGTSYGEWNRTPLGNTYRRTHWREECVRAAREAVGGRPIPEPLSREERDRRAAASNQLAKQEPTP